MAPLLAVQLAPCAWVDADDLWRMHPFEVTPQTKAIVESNLIHHLQQFLRAGYPQVFAIWVLHRQDLIDRLLAPLESLATSTHVIHLSAEEDILRQRIAEEPDRGRPIERALLRRTQIEQLPYAKIRTDDRTPAQVAAQVAGRVRGD